MCKNNKNTFCHFRICLKYKLIYHEKISLGFTIIYLWNI